MFDVDILEMERSANSHNGNFCHSTRVESSIKSPERLTLSVSSNGGKYEKIYIYEGKMYFSFSSLKMLSDFP